MTQPRNRKGRLKLAMLTPEELAKIQRWLKEENVSARECARRLGFGHHGLFLKYLSVAGYAIGKSLVPVRKPLAQREGIDPP
jgi:hypothetical protein